MGTLDDLFRRVEYLNDIGASLSNERDLNRLLEKIILAAKSITRADSGTLYLLSEDKRSLRFELVSTDSLKIAFGGTSGNPVSGIFPDLPLYREDGSPNDAMIAAYAAISGETVNIADAYAAKGFDFSSTRKFDERTGYRSQSPDGIELSLEYPIIAAFSLVRTLRYQQKYHQVLTAWGLDHLKTIAAMVSRSPKRRAL